MQQIEDLIVWIVMKPWDALLAAGIFVLAVITLVAVIWLDRQEEGW